MTSPRSAPALPPAEGSLAIDGDGDLLDQVLAAADPSSGAASFTLPSGRSVEGRPDLDGRDAIVIRSPNGEVELDVVLTPAGPRLRFRAADVVLESSGTLRLECEDLEVSARKGILQRAGGDYRQEVGGNAAVQVAGTLVTEADAATLRSTRGDLLLEANDDVVAQGERVRLNC